RPRLMHLATIAHTQSPHRHQPLSSAIFLSTVPPPQPPTLFPYTTLFRSSRRIHRHRFIARRNSVSAYLVCQSADEIRAHAVPSRSEEHTSELQSRGHLVCRLLLEKKKALARAGRVALGAARARPARRPGA